MHEAFVVDEFVVFGALSFAVGDERAAEVGVDDLYFLELGDGGVVDGVQVHF